MLVLAIVLPVSIIVVFGTGGWCVYKRWYDKRMRSTRNVFHTITPYPYDPVSTEETFST